MIADDDGHPIRMTGTAQDVTEVRATAAAELSRRAMELDSPSRPAGGPRDEFAQILTARQLEILDLVREGLSNAEIADRLFIGESTVEWHVAKILRALRVSSRAQAVARYLAAPG